MEGKNDWSGQRFCNNRFVSTVRKMNMKPYLPAKIEKWKIHGLDVEQQRYWIQDKPKEAQTCGGNIWMEKNGRRSKKTRLKGISETRNKVVLSQPHNNLRRE